MVTDFVAEIPAGTTSATGNQLAETVRWTFSTPPVQIVNSYPSNFEPPLEPVLFVAFDQLINPDAVLAVIPLTANGDTQAVRLATEAEIEADEWVSQMAESAREGYWLALRPAQPLPADASIDVTICPNNKRLKRYLAAKNFKPVFFKPEADLYLSQLKSASDRAAPAEDSWLAEAPDTDAMPVPHRRVSVDVLRAMVSAVRRGRSLEILYQSMNATRLEPTWRWITPHAFSNDGLRWHVRAYCHIAHKI